MLIQANDAVDKVHGIGIGAPNANYYTGTIDDGVSVCAADVDTQYVWFHGTVT